MLAKYEIDSSEVHYEEGSNELVLKNKLGITDPSYMDEIESDLLLRLYEKVFSEDPLPDALSFESILKWHCQWLGNIYDWAGKVRSTNLSKGGFHFAIANQLKKLITEFEADYLYQFEKLSQLDRNEFVQYLTKSHIDFILIHPVRDGNGRLSRLLIDVMAVKAGYQPLDYSLWDQNKDFYFKAIQAGVADNFQHLARLVEDILPN